MHYHDIEAPPPFEPEGQNPSKLLKRDLFGAKTGPPHGVSEFDPLSEGSVEAVGLPPHHQAHLTHSPERTHIRRHSLKDRPKVTAVSLQSQQFLRGIGSQSLRMIEEGGAQEEMSTARGFAPSARLHEMQPQQSYEQPFEFEREHMRSSEGEENDQWDENRLSIPGPPSRRDYSTKETHFEDYPSETEFTSSHVWNRNSRPSSTRNHQNTRYGKNPVPMLSLTHTPSEVSRTTPITPNQFHCPPQESDRLQRGRRHKHSISIPPKEYRDEINPRKAITPNAASTGLKLAMQQAYQSNLAQYQPPTNGLNSSRFEDLHRKKEEIE